MTTANINGVIYIHNVEGKDPEEFTLCDVCGIMLPFEGSQLELIL